MPDCKCGRFFRSAQALEQHQSDRARFSNTTPCVGSASPAKKAKGRASLNEARRNAWVRKDVQEKLLIRTIDYDGLQPAPAAVTSSGDVELVCSYNWKDRWSPSLYVPGTFRSAMGWLYRVPRQPCSPARQAMHRNGKMFSFLPKYPRTLAHSSLTRMPSVRQTIPFGPCLKQRP